MHEVMEKAEEYFLNLIARIDEGDEKALHELKSMKRYMAELNSVLELIDDADTIETIRGKFDTLEKRFDALIMELNRVVG